MELILPNKKYLNDYIKAFEEFEEINESRYHFNNVKEIDVFKKFERYREGRDLKEGKVPQTTYWLIDNDTLIGEINIRKTLNDKLLNYGGNIGYGIRVPFWNKGYGTKMLKMALEKCIQLNLKKVLITCNDDNFGSAKVIENNGGILENKVINIINEKEILTRRYWINL